MNSINSFILQLRFNPYWIEDSRWLKSSLIHVFLILQQNYKCLNDTPQPRNHQRKIENVHLNKSTYFLEKCLQEEISFLRKELDNKQKIIDNLIHLLNSVTAKHDETNFADKRLQIETTSEKASHINETIDSNRFFVGQNKNQLNVEKEQLTAALVVIDYLHVELRSGCFRGHGPATRIIAIIHFLYLYMYLCVSVPPPETGDRLAVQKTFRRRSMTTYGCLVCFQHTSCVVGVIFYL